jgi:hypothetical protein
MEYNNLLEGAFALALGDMVGAVSDRLSSLIDSRLRLIPGMDGKSVLDSLLSVFLHMGLISFGTALATSALPFVTESGPAFLLYTLGVSASSRNFYQHLRNLNQLLFDERIYSEESDRVDKAVENPPVSPVDDAAGSSS